MGNTWYIESEREQYSNSLHVYHTALTIINRWSIFIDLCHPPWSAGPVTKQWIHSQTDLNSFLSLLFYGVLPGPSVCPGGVSLTYAGDSGMPDCASYLSCGGLIIKSPLSWRIAAGCGWLLRLGFSTMLLLRSCSWSTTGGSKCFLCSGAQYFPGACS